MIPLRVVTLAGDPEREATLAGALSRREDVELVLRCVDRVELLAAIRGGELDAVVSVGAPVWLDKPAVEELARGRIKLVGVVADPVEANALANLGASLLPAEAGVDEVVDRSACADVATPVTAPGPGSWRAAGKLVAVWGPKGAPGRTTVAIELAAEVASYERKTVLIDGDAYGGDVAQLLGVTEELPTVVWAAQMAGKDQLESDSEWLERELRRAGRSGPVLLPGIPRADLWADVSDYGWRQLLSAVRACFRFSICDVGFCLEPAATPYSGDGAGRNRTARLTLGSADHVVAVCRSDPVGMKNFLWAFEELRELTELHDVLVVANRVPSGREAEVGAVLKTHVGKTPVAYIPETPGFSRAATMGAPLRELHPSASACSAIRTLAVAIGADLPPRGLLSRLSGRR